jgi:starvation-inducible DNA-binding protein
MRQTSNSLSDHIGSRAAKGLNRSLVAAIELYARVKQTQAILRGPAFAEIQALLENLAEAAASYSDRIGALAGTTRVAVEPAFPKPAELGLAGEDAYLTTLTAALADFGDTMREARAEAKAAGDTNACDVFTAISRGIDYELWVVEAHLAGQRQRQRWPLWVASLRPLNHAVRCEQLSFQRPYDS